MSDPVLLYTIQIIAIASALLLALGILKANPRKRSAHVFAIGALFVVLYILEGMGQAHIHPAFRMDISPWPWRLLVHPAVQAIPGLLMVYCFLVFQNETRFPKFLLLLLGLQVFIEAVVLLPEGGIDVSIPTQLRNGLNASQLLFVGLGIYWVLKGWSDDLIQDRRLLRWLMVAVLGVLVLFTLIVENVFLSRGMIDTAQAQMLNHSVIAFILTLLFIISVRFNYDSLTRLVRQAESLSATLDPSGSIELDAACFHRYFVDTKLYRDSGLTISSLAARLEQPEYRLREFIQKELGHNNFNSMLHHYRITDACEQLADPKNRKSSISTIAISTGYKSVTPFNSAFRKRTGETPSEYRKRTTT